jgi:glucose/mannose transport system substrate-binding protein
MSLSRVNEGETMILTKLSLKFYLILGLLLLAVCGCATVTPIEENTASTSSELPTETSSDHELEIMSPWSAGGGLEALQAVVRVFELQNPGIEVVNAADSGLTYPELVAIFDDRMRKQQPFDSWHVHPGDQVRNHVIVGQVEPLTRLFKDQGLDRVIPSVLVEQITINGEIYSIPLNIHRSNILWYNPVVFEANHLDPPETIEDFFQAAEILENNDIIPLALGGDLGFEVGHLFESVLLATFGPEDYLRLFQAGSDLWDDPRTSIAIETLQKMLYYANDDHLEISFVDAAQRVIDGEAGMMVMGDWVAGYFKSQGAQPKQDFGWSAAPGTDGTFIWISDGFVLATGAENREAGLAWMEIVGSKEGQDAFNPIKGSIPARTDADRSLYGEYLQWSLDQFITEDLVPSVVHGAMGPEPYLIAFGDALVAFSKDLDEDNLLQSLKEAAILLEQ